jgi:hypothetical protein
VNTALIPDPRDVLGAISTWKDGQLKLWSLLTKVRKDNEKTERDKTSEGKRGGRNEETKERKMSGINYTHWKDGHLR